VAVQGLGKPQTKFLSKKMVPGYHSNLLEVAKGIFEGNIIRVIWTEILLRHSPKKFWFLSLRRKF
jgi:hypothetical protein